MHIIVKKWGNSAAVRIPTAIMALAQLRIDDVVDVHEDNGRIIIEPVRTHSYNLQQLLDEITTENRHDVVDFGKPSGKEIL